MFEVLDIKRRVIIITSASTNLVLGDGLLHLYLDKEINVRRIPEFNTWLTEKKGLKDKSARDVLSRCRRIEKGFNTSLEEEVKNKKSLDSFLERMDKESHKYINLGTKHKFVRSVHRRAVRLYSEFMGSQNSLS